MDLLEKSRFKARKYYLLDFGNDKVTGDEEADEKNKTIKRFQKVKQRKNRFTHETNNVGRGTNESLKKIKVTD